nr:hypothetical protein GCM10020063_010440 [Dactylosporangium thailandense]
MSTPGLPSTAPPSAGRSDPLGALQRVADQAPNQHTAQDVNGPDGLWWAACAAAQGADRDRLTSPGIGTILRRLRDEATDAPTGERLARNGSAVVAAALALSSADDADRAHRLDELTNRWKLSHSLPPALARSGLPFALIGAEEPGLAAALADLAKRQATPERSMAGLVLALLGRRTVATRVPLATHVLLDADTKGTSVTGAAARLDICELPGGPPGLYPDPRSMSFFDGDRRFQRGLAAAWEAAVRDVADLPCVLWRMRHTEPMDGYPVSFVSGDSAGAAFAVLLTILLRQRSTAGGLRARIDRVRRLRGRVALTGTVGPDGTIGRITGLSAKLTAAHALKMRPILPQANRGADEQVPGGLEPDWIATVGDGCRLATQWPLKYRRIGIGVAVAALTAVLAGIGGIWWNDLQGDPARHAAVAGHLVDAAREEQDRAPGLAGVLAAQAYAQAPAGSDRAAAARELVRQLTYNGRYDGSAHIDAGHATATAAAATAEGQVLLTGTDRGDILATRIGERQAFTRELGANTGVVQIAVNPVTPSQFAIAGRDGNPAIWRLESGRIKPGTRLDIGVGQRGPIWSVAFSPDGLVLAVGDNQGWVTLFNTATSATLGAVRPHLTLPIQPAAITAVAFGPPGSGMLYAATAAGRLIGIDYRTLAPGSAAPPVVRSIATPEHGPVRALALIPEAGWYSRLEGRAGALLLGTDQGLVAWDLDAQREAVPFPAAGIGERVETLAVRGPLIAVATANRTAVIEHDITAGSRAGSGAEQPAMHSLVVRDVRTGTAPGASLFDDGLLSPAPDGDVRLWRHSRRPLSESPAALANPAVRAEDVGIDADGALYVLGSDGIVVRARDGRTDKGDAGPSGPGEVPPRRLLAVPPTDAVGAVAVADTDPKASQPLVVLDRRTLRPIDVPDLEHTFAGCGGITAVTFAAVEPPALLIGCKSGVVQSWDALTWRMTAAVRLDDGGPAGFATADGAIFVAGGGADSITRLRAGDLTVDGTVASGGGVTALAAVGGHLLTGRADGELQAWSADLHRLGSPVAMGGPVAAIAASTTQGLTFVAVDQNLVVLDSGDLSRVVAAPAGQPIDGLAAGPAGDRIIGRLVPPVAKYAVAGARPATGTTMALSWDLAPAHLVTRACTVHGGDLTDAEFARYSGQDRIKRRPQCAAPAPGPSASGSAAAGPFADVEDGPLVAATAPARQRFGRQCDSLISAGGSCDLISDGEHEYAWTITPGAQVESSGEWEHRLVLYQSSDDQTQWVPVLQTEKYWTGVRIFVREVDGEHGPASLAIGHRTGHRGGFAQLALVHGGRIEATVNTVVNAEPEGDGLRVWVGVYSAADSDASPSNWATYVLHRADDGHWSAADWRPIARADIPRSDE